ncbi:MAG: hypothetical protein AAGL98_12570, partial [Planctomycetota bacterium]
RWSRLVADIRTAVPELPLTVWRFEDYPKLEGPLMSRILLGDPSQRLDYEGIDELVRPGLSDRALKSLIGIDRAETKRRFNRTLKSAMAEFPKGRDFPGPQPFSEEERAALDEFYRQDLREIAAMPGVTALWDSNSV